MNSILIFALGALVGIAVSTLIARRKFAKLQEGRDNVLSFAQERIQSLREALVELGAELGIERSLNEGLQAELHDSAVPASKRLATKTQPK